MVHRSSRVISPKEVRPRTLVRHAPGLVALAILVCASVPRCLLANNLASINHCIMTTMDTSTRSGLLQLSDLVRSFHASFRDETRVQGDPISDSLSNTFRLTLIPQKCQVFWKPRPLKQDAFSDTVSKVRDERYELPADFLPPPVEKSFEIYDAYDRSRSTHADILTYVSNGMFHSDDFCNTETGQCEFLCFEYALYLSSPT